MSDKIRPKKPELGKLKDITLDSLVETVGEAFKKIRNDCNKLGMLPKTIDKFVGGHKIINHKDCNTYNSYDIHYDRENNETVRYCVYCDKLYTIQEK